MQNLESLKEFKELKNGDGKTGNNGVSLFGYFMFFFFFLWFLRRPSSSPSLQRRPEVGPKWCDCGRTGPTRCMKEVWSRRGSYIPSTIITEEVVQHHLKLTLLCTGHGICMIRESPIFSWHILILLYGSDTTKIRIWLYGNPWRSKKDFWFVYDPNFPSSSQQRRGIFITHPSPPIERI